MEAVFPLGNFRMFSGDLHSFADGNNRKRPEVIGKIQAFPSENTASIIRRIPAGNVAFPGGCCWKWRLSWGKNTDPGAGIIVLGI